MRRTWPALIDRDTAADGRSIYGITFPDFPGCVSVGDTPDEALRAGEEALTGHVAAMAADGDPLPVPSPVEAVRAGADPADVVALVTVPLPGRTRRINVMLDEALIEEIDAVTRNRSAFLAAAARAELARR